MVDIGEPIIDSISVHDIDRGLAFAKRIGYPVVVRPAYTLGGTGGGMANNDEELRKRMPGVYFLIPGYGAQGGGVEDVLSGFNDDGLGAIINSSRSVICAYMRSPWKEEFPPRRFADAARAEVLRMRREIDTGLSKKGLRPW